MPARLCGINGCTKLPYFGPAKGTATRCLNHSIDGDVNVRAIRKAKTKVAVHIANILNKIVPPVLMSARKLS